MNRSWLSVICLLATVGFGSSSQGQTTFDNHHGARERLPAYLQTAPAPRLLHIQPEYQSAFRIDRGLPYSAETLRLPRHPNGSLYEPRRVSPRWYGRSSTSRSPLSTLTAGRPRHRYRPYVTVSQYVYVPTYASARNLSPLAALGAVPGAYGLSAYGGLAGQGE